MEEALNAKPRTAIALAWVAGWFVVLSLVVVAYNIAIPLGILSSALVGALVLYRDVTTKRAYSADLRKRLSKLIDSGNIDSKSLNELLLGVPSLGRSKSTLNLASIELFDDRYFNLRATLGVNFFEKVVISVSLIALPLTPDRPTPVGVFAENQLIGFIPDSHSAKMYSELIHKAGAIKTSAEFIFAIRSGMHVCKVFVPKNWLR